MSKLPANSYEREIRDTILKSSLTGVAATVLAVTVFSPAGLGGLVGTSLASGFGLDTSSAPGDDVYANLPAYPAPLSREEVSQIQSRLAETNASLEFTRAATAARIDHIRAIALGDGVVSFTAMPQPSPRIEGLRSRMSETPVVAAPAQAAATTAPNGAQFTSFRDANLELAELMFAHENL